MRVPFAGGPVGLPSGLTVVGRPLGRDLGPADFTLVLGRGPAPSWDHRRVRWPDFWVPLDTSDAADALREAYSHLQAGRRVEVACRGGVGRTGTTVAALAVLDGLGPDDAVAWVRRRYHPRAVETPWQRRWVRRFGAGRPPQG